MKIIYGICSWGLGHATRSLPIIRKLISENHDLTIITHGRSLQLLKKEIGIGPEYIEMPDYPMLLSENSRQFMAKSLIYWPKFVGSLHLGFNRVKEYLNEHKVDRIISDGRYEIYSRNIPSFFISHQIRIMNPLRIGFIERGSETFNMFFFKRYAGVIIPDYRTDNLSGDLSHNLKKIDEKKLHYVGVLSDFSKKDVSKDIDFLISISGPEPQRTIFENKILNQIDDLDGNIVVTLGRTEKETTSHKENIKMYSFLNKEKREEFLNRSKIVISRSGYSTLMDLAVVGCKALMVPTPGQIEQEYLSEYHNSKNTFYSVNQEKINLKVDFKKVENTTGIKRDINVDKTVEKTLDIIYNIKK